MLFPVIISLAVIFVTIFIHGLGTVWGVQLLINKGKRPDKANKLHYSLYVVSVSVVFLMILHFLEITIWAFVFMIIPNLKELTTFEEAIYFSLVTFTTVGYGDITLGNFWRIMSGFEAMNGIILFGWSTAVLFSVVQKTIFKANGT